VEDIHIILEKKDAQHAVLEKAKRLENILGKTKKSIKLELFKQLKNI